MGRQIVVGDIGVAHLDPYDTDYLSVEYKDINILE
jgi:hypothetical protein